MKIRSIQDIAIIVQEDFLGKWKYELWENVNPMMRYVGSDQKRYETAHEAFAEGLKHRAEAWKAYEETL